MCPDTKWFLATASSAVSSGGAQWVVPTNGDLFLFDTPSGNLVSENGVTFTAEGTPEYSVAGGAVNDGIRNDAAADGFVVSPPASYDPGTDSLVVMAEFTQEIAPISSQRRTLLDFGSNQGVNHGLSVWMDAGFLTVNLATTTNQYLARWAHGGAIIGQSSPTTIKITFNRSQTDASLEVNGQSETLTRLGSSVFLSSVGSINITNDIAFFKLASADLHNFEGVIYRVAYALDTITYDGTNQ